MKFQKLISTVGFLFFLSCVHCLLGSSLEALQAELKKPATIFTAQGRTFTGHIKSIGTTELTLKETTGTGSIESTYQFENIRRIDLPGNHFATLANEAIENDDHETAIAIMDMLYRQRIRLLRWQPASVALFLSNLADLQLQHGDAYQAIGVATNVLPYISDQRVREDLEDVILLGHYRLPINIKAKELSEKWMANRKAYGRSALGWYVQAQLFYDEAHYQKALKRALEPIVFSSQFPMSYLEHCYVIAIAAAEKLDNLEHAKMLHQEMQERGLEWPPTSTLPATSVHTQPQEDTSN